MSESLERLARDDVVVAYSLEDENVFAEGDASLLQTPLVALELLETAHAVQIWLHSRCRRAAGACVKAHAEARRGLRLSREALRAPDGM